MRLIMSLADKQLVAHACQARGDMIRIGPYPGEDLEVWGIDEILKGIQLGEEAGKGVQVRLPVSSCVPHSEVKTLLEKLATKPEVELVLGSWYQAPLQTPNPKVAGENLNITNSDEIELLSRWGVYTITFPRRWTPDAVFWKNIPNSSRFECYIKGPVHVGWLCLDGLPDGDFIPSLPDEQSLPFYNKRGQLWSKFINPIPQKNPLITRKIVEYLTLEELTEGLS